MTTTGSICIAGYHYGLINQTKSVLAFDIGFEDFLHKEHPVTDRLIVFEEGFVALPVDQTLYHADNQGQLLWKIIEHNQERWFLVYHPQSGLLQQQAQYNTLNRTWTIRCAANTMQNESVINPLAYPMAPLLWYILTTEEPLLLMHASGVLHSNCGRIFAGFSGVGKSTMAGIWERNGAKVINDDRLLLKKEEDGCWRMYNTPMYYRAQPVSGPVSAIYLPFHSPQNIYQKLNGAMAMANLLAFTIHHGYDTQHVLHHSHIAEQLLQDVPIAKLGVVPTEAIIDFITANEQSAT